jgi:Ni2+-binding GTPase involved in maturation of urease and hydrogenase
MSEGKVIKISVSGPVQCGKSAVLASIRDMLSEYGYCVVNPDRSERNNPSDPIHNSAEHEKPHLDKTIIVLNEDIATTKLIT